MRISRRRLAWLGVCALGAGCNQFIGLEDVSLVGDAGVDPDAPIDTADASPDAPVDAAPIDLFVFVTQQSSTGDFSNGGTADPRTNVDNRCENLYQEQFTAKGCTNIHAVIQIDAVDDSLARMDINFPIPQNTPVLRATDDTPIANSWDDLVNPNLNLVAPVSTEAGPINFWSGVPTNNCNDWTSAASGVVGSAGDATVTNSWLSRGDQDCSNFDQVLLCVCW